MQVMLGSRVRKTLRSRNSSVLLLLAALLLFPFLSDAAQTKQPLGHLRAEASIQGKSSYDLKGELSCDQAGKRVVCIVQLKNAPVGTHGVHLHEKGDCSAEDAKSAGEHFNPTQVKHGSPSEKERHAGDFGNIEVKKDGTGTLVVSTEQLSLTPNLPNSAIGKAIIIHSAKDDFVSQPAGNSGTRIGCGVVQSENITGNPIR